MTKQAPAQRRLLAEGLRILLGAAFFFLLAATAGLPDRLAAPQAATVDEAAGGPQPPVGAELFDSMPLDWARQIPTSRP